MIHDMELMAFKLTHEASSYALSERKILDKGVLQPALEKEIPSLLHRYNTIARSVIAGTLTQKEADRLLNLFLRMTARNTVDKLVRQSKAK